jgi:hypothetical protein
MNGRRPEAEPLLTPAEVATMFRVERTSPTFVERVFAKVDASGDCWEWTAANIDGYGAVGRGSREAGTMQAHRAVWELLVGPIEDGLQLDHLCRNHACVNPDHLEPVTDEENKRRGYSIAVLHSLRDTCGFGHPKDGITRRKDGTSHRYCKTCARLKASARYVPKGPRTHCKHRHEFTPENTYTDGRGCRQCKACKIGRQRAARAVARAEMGKAA